MSRGLRPSGQPPEQFLVPGITVSIQFNIARKYVCIRGIAYHLASSNHTQRLDLGSRSRGSGAESTRGNGGASLAEHLEGRQQHGDSVILW